MKEVLIKIEDYSYRLGKVEILKNISLTVREGEYVSVVGPNGAGKTTLLKCLNRIYTGGKGAIEVAGRPLRAYSQRELARIMSYVPQVNGGVLPFSVYEFVLMGRYPYLGPFSSTRPEDKDAVDLALDMTGLAGLEDRFLDSLSGGERQKVFIAAALAQGTKLLLLDEPATFLDPRHQVEINLILKKVNRESGVTIITVTHDINTAFSWSEKILALKDGEVAFCGPASEIIDKKILAEIYGISFRLVEQPDSETPLVMPEVAE
ncbi:MAG: ABC transporter ATP-binding protein [Deltaproteobacteria bacterium]|nr:ABC transporter ATP-binding protein [Deltaproteobacteria bacterium]